MLKEKKAHIVDQLAENLSCSTIIIATSYQGLTAKQMTELRRVLADADIGYRVIKNTLAYFATQRAGKGQLMNLVEGPTALVFGYDDVVKPAEVLARHIKSTDLDIQIRGALLGERVLNAEEVATLASLPPREVLISQLIANLQAPIQSLHNVLTSPWQRLLNVLQARVQELSK
jgi:large subunit ribosomal protein L10